MTRSLTTVPLLAALLLPLGGLTAKAGSDLDLSLAYKQYFPGGRSALVPQGQHQGIEMQLDMDVLPFLFFNNLMHASTDASQFASVGWQYQLGVRITDGLDTYYEHHSQHRLDAGYAEGYPLEDSIAVKWTIRSKTKRESIW